MLERERWSRRWEVSVRALVAAVTSLAAGGLLLGFAGAYEPLPLVVVTVFGTALLTWAWNRLQPGSVDPEDGGLALLAGVAGVIGITVYHAAHAGNFLLMTRDPAFYNLAALELARDGDLVLAGLSERLQSIGGVLPVERPITPTGDRTGGYIQGFHGLGAVIAPLHWLGGLHLLLKGPALFGGATLLLLRRLAARFVSPWSATAVTLGFGLSIPFAVFNRDPYSESIFLFFVLAGMLVLLEGDLTPTRAALTGVLAGASATGRVDALLVVAGFVVVLGTVPVIVERRRLRPVELASGAAALGGTTALFLLLGRARSPGYVSDLREEVVGSVAVLVLGVGGTVALLVVVWLLRRRGFDSTRLRHPRFVAGAGALVVALGLAWWLLAPAVIELHKTDGPPLVSGLQAREGADIDQQRTYGEESLARLAMHYGDLAVVLAIGGAAFVVARLLQVRDRSLYVLAVIGATSLPYLVQPRISSDLPWAMRRFYPVTIPVMLVLAGLAVDWLQREGGPRVRAASPALLVALVGLPALALGPVGGVRHAYPVASVIEGSICEVLPPDALLVLEDPFWARSAGPALHQVCELEVVSMLEAADRPSTIADLADVAAAEGRVLGILSRDGVALPEGLGVSRRSDVDFSVEVVQRTVEKLPAGGEPVGFSVDLLVVEPA